MMLPVKSLKTVGVWKEDGGERAASVDSGPDVLEAVSLDNFLEVQHPPSTFPPFYPADVFFGCLCDLRLRRENMPDSGQPRG